MTKPTLLRIAAGGFLLAASPYTVAPAQTQSQTQPGAGEWRYYASDLHSTKYSPLDQINAANAKQLQVAWRWTSDNYGPRPEANMETTPLMIGGVLYFNAGSRRVIVAVDAGTGETLWVYRLDEGTRAGVFPRPYSRGVAYWTDGKGDDRILAITTGYHLVALDAKTGIPVPSFGDKGLVDLFNGLERLTEGEIGSTSPPLVVKNVVVVGASGRNGTAPKSKTNTPGDIRGFDVRTGKLLWTFHTIPHAGEFGNDTWKNDSWKYTGNAGVWAPMSADPELGYIYLPVESGTGDYYGGERPGNDLFGESLVCLDAQTGKRVWHYQIVHHGVWDWDNPAAPVLLDITVDGKKIKAVAQVTKQAFVYTFDRVTGKPVWPIEERPVPQSDVPGEQTSPTQPFPTKPPAFDRQGTSLDVLDDLTPAIHAEAVRIASQYKLGPIFTPPIVADTNGKRATMILPSVNGGANWEGAAVDPETGVLYVGSVTDPFGLALVKGGDRSDMKYIGGRPTGRPERPLGMPLVKPPWGRITAIDMNKGEHLWMKANGPAPEIYRNNPAAKGLDLSEAGNPAPAVLLVTKTLLFAGEGAGLVNPAPGGGGNLLRILDKKTGALIHQIELPGVTSGCPMTYTWKGKQYVVIATTD
ncbi:MAG TPA: PQQ-binding-like beta-propeller repeat protein, partial [Bryobacteraceae bacterium]|nr:PQQ-binding-like beta-propeller repeat protein [Bryobacteraceae bacterium]